MINTAQKRKSASGIPFLPLGPGVTPNVLKDAEWRQEAAWGYSGIPVNPTPPVTAKSEWLIRARRRGRR